MKRRTWKLFCLFSLLVFVVTAIAWLLSGFAMYSAERWTTQVDRSSRIAKVRTVAYAIRLSRGSIIISRTQYGYLAIQPSQSRWQFRTFAPFDPLQFKSPYDLADIRCGVIRWHTLGFVNTYGWNATQSFVISLWLFLPAGVPPFLWWRKRRRGGGRGFPVSVAAEKQIQ